MMARLRLIAFTVDEMIRDVVSSVAAIVLVICLLALFVWALASVY